ncbi:HalOD1 output domain-containing protein [Halostagnicola larsenii]|nr:HalOD1 output domain-containing protein [Halostagnicola larsenii]
MNDIEFDGDEDTFRAEYDSRRDQPSLAVVAVVAAVDDRDPGELTPLHFVIDTEALDDLFTETAAEGLRNGNLSFSYEGFDVTAFSRGTIEISPIPNA